MANLASLTKKEDGKLKNIAFFLIAVGLVVFIPLTPDLYREYQQDKFEKEQKICYGIQKQTDEAVKKFLADNSGKLFSPGTLAGSELIGNLINGKFLAQSPVCPASGTLRIGSLDLSGAYVVSCSIHGSEDRQASRSGKIVLKTDAGGTLIYDAAIVRDQADVLAAYLLSAGVLQDPNTQVTAELFDKKLQISFKANINKDNSAVFKERTLFHAREISRQIFPDQEVEFKLFPADGSRYVLINSVNQ